jgi:hypothetical protein
MSSLPPNLVMESLQWGRMPHLFPTDHIVRSPIVPLSAVTVDGRQPNDNNPRRRRRLDRNEERARKKMGSSKVVSRVAIAVRQYD